MTPLRWKILFGYLLAGLIAWLLWDDLANGWKTLVTAMAPIVSLFAAIFALKFTIVLTSLGSFLLVFLQGFITLLIAVSKVGIIKGLFLPWVLAAAKWLHLKSEGLQSLVSKAIDWLRALADRVYQWWSALNIIDRILMLGFVAPLVIVIILAVLLKEFVYLFISKKAVEQLVSRTTKAVVSNFHKIPVLGKIPAWSKMLWQKLVVLRDRKLETLRRESHARPDPD